MEMDRNKRTYSRECPKKVKLFGKEIDNKDDYDEILFETISPKPKLIEINSPKKHETSQQATSPQCSPFRLPEVDRNSQDSLDWGRMLNDTVVEFYMNYLLARFPPNIRENVHLFNTFFYNKILKLPQLSETEINDSVRRWDKHAKLFDKDYLVVPICCHHHWLLVIICFAHKLPAHDDPIMLNEPDTRRSSACMIIFDSLGYKYMSKFSDPIRNFLEARWQFERPNAEKRNFKDRTLFKDFSARVPKQRNSYDCGVHLLNSFERFFANPLLYYTRIRADKDLSIDWSVDTKQKRLSIRSLFINTSPRVP